MAEKVLVIEDTRSFASMLKKLIESTHGFTTDVADSLASATALLDDPNNQYFVSIVDLHLPDACDGEAVDLAKRYGIPTVVLTGTHNDTMKEDLWSKGIADYAHKSGKHSLEFVLNIIKRIYLNSNIKVLIVDDSRVARATMEQMLHIQRYQVLSADSGEAALQKLEDNPDICVVITDCYMKGMQGFELAIKIREKYASDELAIIGVSAKGGQYLSAEFIKSGANDFLLKPFLPEEFFCRVNHNVSHIENYRELKQLNAENRRLLGTAAHDIRGPLGVIFKTAQLIQRDSCRQETKEQFIKLIERSSDDLLELLNNLLDVSAIESGQLNIDLSDHNFGDIVQERVSLYQLDADQKGIQINVNNQNDKAAKVDKTKIKQVIDNLLTNAIKYSPQDSQVNVQIVTDADGIQCNIEDCGPGISPDERKKLFKPFSVLSSKTTGGEKSVGLGLAISKKIMEAHQGVIGYRDGNNGGSCFYIKFPTSG